MEIQSADNEVVTLVLGDNRVEANREKLSLHSLYFASLFSENFKDHRQDEFTINYDVSLVTLKNFVNWVNNEGEHTRVVHSPKYYFVVRASLEKFLNEHYYAELLELLELSVVFMAEKLTENLMEIIISIRLAPNKMLDIWQLAENLGLRTLRNVALAKCLERFRDLEINKLAVLPVEHFCKLLLNINARCTAEERITVREEWKKVNEIPKDLPDSFSQFLNGDAESVKTAIERKKPHYVQCLAVNKMTKSLGILAWNGKDLQELAEMTDQQMHTTFDDNGKEITGRQVVGRDFTIYLIGGEQGIGSGRFNTAIWRYCLFSKKWYIETLLPRPRRHMAVAFIEDNLYLIGGVGRHRLKLSSVDVYNVLTGKWSKASSIPEDFTEVPPSYVTNNKFIYRKSFCYIYDPITDKWSNCRSAVCDSSDCPCSDFPLNTDYAKRIRSIDFSSGDSDDAEEKLIVYGTDLPWYNSGDDDEYSIAALHKTTISWPQCGFRIQVIHEWKNRDRDDPKIFQQQIINWPFLVGFCCRENRVAVEVGELINDDAKPRNAYRRLKAYTKELDDINPDGFNLRLGCFNLYDPDSLHSLILLPDQQSISV